MHVKMFGSYIHTHTHICTKLGQEGVKMAMTTPVINTGGRKSKSVCVHMFFY
jgi:hypothetical protein